MKVWLITNPTRSMSDIVPMPPMVSVEVATPGTALKSGISLGTSDEAADTWQAGVLVGAAVKVCVGVLVRVGVLVGVLVGPTVGHVPVLLISRPQAINVPVSCGALSLTKSVHVPLAF